MVTILLVLAAFLAVVTVGCTLVLAYDAIEGWWTNGR